MAYTAIDIGAGATDRNATRVDGSTILGLDNPSNASGILTSFEIWANSNITGCKIGTLSGSSTNYTSRDVESIGNVTSGSKQTFTGKNCDVSSGDFLGAYWSTGSLERSSSGGGGTYVKSGDQFGTGTQTYLLGSGAAISLYATGITIPDAPTNVAATDDLSDKVTITWTAGTGETGGHRVYRGGVDVSGVVAHGTNTYDDVPAAGTYSYTVKAINAAGLSAASSADNGTLVATTGGGNLFGTNILIGSPLIGKSVLIN